MDRAACALLLLLTAAACKSSEPTPAPSTAGSAVPATMTLTSSDFEAQGAIPKPLTCEGGDGSPALSWSGAPPGTKSLALIIDDPDAPDPAAPKTTWVHWVVFDIPADASSIPAGAGKDASKLPAGTKVGKNDWDRADYGGPCPPVGRHRYFHKIYALDAQLGLSEPTKAELEKAMQGHILARGELIGTYQKAGDQ